MISHAAFSLDIVCPEITNTHVIRSTDKTLSECSVGAFRQARQRLQGILCVFTRALTQYGGKQTASNEMILSVLRIKRYNGVLYDITRVDTFEVYKEEILLCIAVDGQGNNAADVKISDAGFI